jgi:hypothetical protein
VSFPTHFSKAFGISNALKMSADLPWANKLSDSVESQAVEATQEPPPTLEPPLLLPPLVPPLALESIMEDAAELSTIPVLPEEPTQILEPIMEPIVEPMRNATPEEKERQGIAATTMLRLLDLSGISQTSGELDSDILISGSRKPLSSREEAPNSPRAGDSRRASSRRAGKTNVISVAKPATPAKPTTYATKLSPPIPASAPPPPPQASPVAVSLPLPIPSSGPSSSQAHSLISASSEDITIKGQKERLRVRDSSPEKREPGLSSHELESLNLTGLNSLLQSPSKIKNTDPISPPPPTIQLSPYSLIGSFTGAGRGGQLVSPVASKIHRNGDKRVDDALQKYNIHQKFSSHVLQQHEQQQKPGHLFSPTSTLPHFHTSTRSDSPPLRPQSPPRVPQDGHFTSATETVAMGAYLTHGAFGGSVPIKSDVERGVMFERHPTESVKPALQPFFRGNPALSASQSLTVAQKVSDSAPLPAVGGGATLEVSPARSKMLPNGVPASRLESARKAKVTKTSAARHGLISPGNRKRNSPEAIKGSGASSSSPVPSRSHPSVPLLSLQDKEQHQIQHAGPAMMSPGGFVLDSPEETPRFQTHTVVMHKAIETSIGFSSAIHGGSISVKRKSLGRGSGASVGDLSELSGAAAGTAPGSPVRPRRNARILDKIGQLESPALNAKTSEPILDDSFFRDMKRHFQQTAINQKAELQKKMNGSLGPILQSFGVKHVAEGS